MYNFSTQTSFKEEIKSTRLGSFLKSLRKEHNYTLREVASASEDYEHSVSSSLVSDAEKGATTPSVKKLITLSKIYRVQPQRFLELIDLDTVVAREKKESSIENQKKQAREALKLGNYSRALELYESILSSMDEREEFFRMKNKKGICLWKLGKLNWARDEFENILSFEGLSNYLKLQAYNNLSEVFRKMGNYEMATATGKSALDISDKMGNLKLKGKIQNNMGNVTFDIYESTSRIDIKKLEKAIKYYKSALNCFKKAGAETETAVVKVNLGNSITLTGRYSKGESILKEGLKLCKEEDNKRYIAFAYTSLGRTHYETDSYEAAKDYFYESEIIAKRGDYFDLRFINNFYRWLIAREHRNEPFMKRTREELKYLKGKLEGEFTELRQFENFLNRSEQ